MQVHEGIGLAAPQIGQNMRVFVAELDANDDSEDGCSDAASQPRTQPIIVINPTIMYSASGDVRSDIEGCLSLPGVIGVVPRAHRIDVSYLDGDGRLQRRSQCTCKLALRCTMRPGTGWHRTERNWVCRREDAASCDRTSTRCSVARVIHEVNFSHAFSAMKTRMRLLQISVSDPTV